MEIKINSNEAIELSKLIGKLNIKIPVVTTDEARKEQPNTTQMSAKEIEKLGTMGGDPVIPVDDKVIQLIPQLIEEYKESQHWYNRFNKAIREILGESNGALFLSIMAAFSARNQLGPNLSMATRAYHAVIQDLLGREKLLVEYISTVINNPPSNVKSVMKKYDEENPGHKYESLRYHQYIVTHASLGNHIGMTNKVILYYIKNGKTIDSKTLSKLIGSSLKISGDITKNKDNFTSGYKILNFALNLLDPEMVIDGINWQPVTIDTWMIYFFYPDIVKMKGKDKLKAKGIFFDKYKHYVYLGKIVQEQASKYGMKPHELQAVIWTATIKKYEPGSASTDVSGIMEKMIKTYNEEQQELSNIISFTNKLKAIL